MKSVKKNNAMFLGQGRIAANIIQEIMAVEQQVPMDIRVVVSNAQFVAEFNKKYAQREILSIDNANRNVNQIEQAIVENNINLLISVQHPWILPASTLDLVGKYAFNLHNAKLPDYKGYNSISHAILNNDTDYTSTIHWMDPEVDKGDIAYEASVRILPDDDALSLYLRSIDSSMDIFNIFLKDMAAEIAPPRKPMGDGGMFYPRGLASTYKDITNVTDTAEWDRRIRASFFPPFEPAYVKIKSRKYHLIPDNRAEMTWQSLLPQNLPCWDK